MQLNARGVSLDLSSPQVMGILNVTPDSFSDGGKYTRLDAALRHTEAMVTAGAALIDVGGESTRPGANPVSVAEELQRVIPVVEAIAARFSVWISVDTSHPQVIRESVTAGAHLINDVRALRQPGALEAAAESGLPICLMHSQGEPKVMQCNPQYQDVITEVEAYLAAQISRCTDAGIDSHRLIIDPGFGFGKSVRHNYQLLAHLTHYHCFGLPILVGMSRKSMIGERLQVPIEERVIGSVACAVVAAMQGAHIIRVHDVAETVAAMRIVSATFEAR